MSYAHDMFHNDGGSGEMERESYGDDYWSSRTHRDGFSFVEREPIRPSEDPSLWVDRTGSARPLSDLTDLHLARALATTVDKDGITHARSKALLAELTKRSHGEPRPAPSPKDSTSTASDGAGDLIAGASNSLPHFRR
jgi:hypothetical protein